MYACVLPLQLDAARSEPARTTMVGDALGVCWARCHSRGCLRRPHPQEMEEEDQEVEEESEDLLEDVLEYVVVQKGRHSSRDMWLSDRGCPAKGL